MNISLIGMSGVGKTTVGKILAKKLNANFLDTDDLIRKSVNLDVQEFLNVSGDKKFLDMEEKVIFEIEFDNNRPTVIATGGSVIYRKFIMKFLKKNTNVIFLNDTFENIFNRRSKTAHAVGIVGLKNKSFRELFDERVGLYEKYCTTKVSMSHGVSPEENAFKIMETLGISTK